MSTALNTIPPKDDLASIFTLSQQLCKTEFVPDAYRDRPQATQAAILYGRELGIGPLQSLQQVQVIKGKPSASPELMRALIQQQGHTIFREDYSDTHVTLYGKRADTGAEDRVTWTLDDANRAGLTGNSTWKKYPRAMLMARATSELARALFSDVISGLSYTPEEAENFDSEPNTTVEAVEVTRDNSTNAAPDDSTVTVESVEVEQNEPASPITDKQKQRIGILRRELALDDDKYRGALEQKCGVRSATELTEEQATSVIQMLEQAKNKQAETNSNDDPTARAERRTNPSVDDYWNPESEAETVEEVTTAAVA